MSIQVQLSQETQSEINGLHSKWSFINKWSS